jgi:hypothetical protein
MKTFVTDYLARVMTFSSLSKLLVSDVEKRLVKDTF